MTQECFVLGSRFHFPLHLLYLQSCLRRLRRFILATKPYKLSILSALKANPITNPTIITVFSFPFSSETPQAINSRNHNSVDQSSTTVLSDFAAVVWGSTMLSSLRRSWAQGSCRSRQEFLGRTKNRMKLLMGLLFGWWESWKVCGKKC